MTESPVLDLREGETFGERLAQMARDAVAWARKQEAMGPPLLHTGTAKLPMRRRGGGVDSVESVITVEVFHELSRIGHPIPGRIWHQYPDGRLEKSYADEELAPRPASDGSTFRLPTAMEARNEGSTTPPTEIEPISEDPHDFNAEYLFVARRRPKRMRKFVRVQTASGNTFKVAADELGDELGDR